MLRSKSAMAYSGKENKYLEKSIDDNIAKLIRLIETKYLSTATEFKPVDMGNAFGNLESDEDVYSYIKTVEDMFPLLTILAEIGSATLSSPITDSEARKLPYVQAVIKEGLRIFPPITSFISKTAPATGDTVKNVHIPPGTTIGWSAFVVLRSEEIWGLDANFFRPERWLEGSPAERQRKEQEVEMCFGYGKYQCLGKNIAYIELKKIYVELLRNFKFTIVDPVISWKSFNAGLFLHSDLYIRVTKRVPSL